MKPTIKMIEDLSLNAWPSHQIQLYDGWLLRFSYFYTHRTNCVEQIGPSSIPIEEKINFCEDAYHRWGTPSIFKITPLLPDDFEKRLIDRRYAVQHVTEVMTLDLAPWQITMPPVSVRLERTINDRWIQSLFALKSTTSAIHRQIVPLCTMQFQKTLLPLPLPIATDRLSLSDSAFWIVPTWESMRSMCILITADINMPVPFVLLC